MPSPLVAGTVETIAVLVLDQSGVVTNLGSVSSLVFDVWSVDPADDTNDVEKMTDIAATNVGMTALCIVDTTSGGVWVPGKYRLYLKFTYGSESPILGPVEFYVIEGG